VEAEEDGTSRGRASCSRPRFPAVDSNERYVPRSPPRAVPRLRLLGRSSAGLMAARRQCARQAAAMFDLTLADTAKDAGGA
jgi:hypothetical protein